MELPEVVVLDTHIWAWWVSEPSRLSRRARKTIDAAAGTSRLFLSSISVWEISLLVARDRLKLKMDVEDWIARSEALPFLHFVPVDNHIAMRANRLPEPLHPDPADRIIIATTLILGGVLVTKDQKIRDYSHIKTVW